MFVLLRERTWTPILMHRWRRLSREAYALTRRAESPSDKVGRAPLSHTNKTLTSTSLPLYFQVVVCFCLRKKKLVQTNIKWRGLENINNSSSTLFKLKSVLCCIHRRPAQHPGEIKGLFWNGGRNAALDEKQAKARRAPIVSRRNCIASIALQPSGSFLSFLLISDLLFKETFQLFRLFIERRFNVQIVAVIAIFVDLKCGIFQLQFIKTNQQLIFFSVS